MLFYLRHNPDNSWSVLNSRSEYWCGDHEWVSLNSSYYQLDLDCYPKKFTKKEMNEFIKEKFNYKGNI